MINYSEPAALSNPGTTYRRTRYIGIHNNTDSTAAIQILEADAAFINAKKVNIDGGVGGISETINLADPAQLLATFPLRDPTTDALITGASASVGQAFAILYSYSRAKQTARDAAQGQAP